jgi:RimJ/RimL family protein N-acetyltransferase
VRHYRTERLVVGDWAQTDAQAALGIYGRAEVTRWLGAPPMKPVESVEAMTTVVRAMISRNAGRPGYGLWPVRRIADDALVGAILLAPVQGGQAMEPGGDSGAEPDVEIGWHFNPDYWGHGYATEAAAGAAGLAFRSRGLDRVIAVVYPGNARSLAVCARLGMTSHGRTSTYYGVELELFSLDKDSWPAADPGRR